MCIGKIFQRYLWIEIFQIDAFILIVGSGVLRSPSRLKAGGKSNLPIVACHSVRFSKSSLAAVPEAGRFHWL
jgi:hypothetical protein